MPFTAVSSLSQLTKPGSDKDAYLTVRDNDAFLSPGEIKQPERL